MMNINLNDEVTFTITQQGLDKLAASDHKLGLEAGLSAKCWRHNPKTNQCTAPLWDVMGQFGEFMYMGANKQPIKGNSLKLPTKKRAHTRKETITWITDGTLPDSDITVLLSVEDVDVDTAFHDGERWRWYFDGGRVVGPIKAWADLPEGLKP